MLLVQGWPPGLNCEVGVCLQNLPASFSGTFLLLVPLGNLCPPAAGSSMGPLTIILGALPSLAVPISRETLSPSLKSKAPGLSANPKGQIREMYLCQW